MDLPFPDRLYMRPSISGPVLLFSDIDSDSRVTSGPVPVWLEVLITLRDHKETSKALVFRVLTETVFR